MDEETELCTVSSHIVVGSPKTNKRTFVVCSSWPPRDRCSKSPTNASIDCHHRSISLRDLAMPFYRNPGTAIFVARPQWSVPWSANGGRSTECSSLRGDRLRRAASGAADDDDDGVNGTWRRSRSTPGRPR